MPQPPGRRPEWLIAEPIQQLPYLDVAVIDSDGFVTLPIHGRRLVSWLDDITKNIFLGDLKISGCVRITPWDESGDRVKELINSYTDTELQSDTEKDHLLILRAQFVRLRRYRNGQLKLPRLVIAQVSEELRKSIACYVAFFEDHIELWSSPYHHTRLLQQGADLAELDD